METDEYIRIQRKVFIKYKVEECLIVNGIIEFNKLCACISNYKECELTYSTTKQIIKLVRKFKKGAC